MPAKTKSAAPTNSAATIGKTVEDDMVAIGREWQMANAEARMWN